MRSNTHYSTCWKVLPTQTMTDKKINWKKIFSGSNILIALVVLYLAVDIGFRLFCGT